MIVELKQKKQKKSRKSLGEHAWFQAMISFASQIFRVAPIKKYIEGTIGGMLGTISRFLLEKKYAAALQLCCTGMKKCYKQNDVTTHYFWWSFMKNAVYCAHMLDNHRHRNKLVCMAENGVHPMNGYDVAYCFCYFSKWKYVEGRYDLAIDYARRARMAEKSWGEPDFLLGWYALFIEQSDPTDHFLTAIKKNAEYLTIITHDPILAEFPNIIDQVRALRVA